ncbi:MAG: HAD family hydrolase [Ilumatobacter sp.]|uniref:HAD family hydrolase n=1 Tax=Ilumatobacter sp. TaxID=1967498 RepID=UPI00260DCFB5|nr:HAD family hydrolase [Ilumatobacter sp.]MDJ0769050.1 HAD family hydrolase [Ilumatobacter sp.]
MANGDRFDVVGFDADDTLWRSEDFFTEAHERFKALVEPYAPQGVDVLDALHATESDNIPISGYGVKAYALSMVQAAVTVTGGQVPASVIGELVDHAHEMLMHPVELLPGVPEALAAVGASHRIVLITKGDLVHQTRKVRTSGLEHHFEHIRVVLDKDLATYRRVLDDWSVDPPTFLMVGNSVKSDILPILELGGHGVHIPYHVTWAHEVVHDHDGDFDTLTSISELPGWLAGG